VIDAFKPFAVSVAVLAVCLIAQAAVGGPVLGWLAVVAFLIVAIQLWPYGGPGEWRRRP
jgi:hypothetical protein